MMKFNSIFVLFFMLLLLASCSTTSKLPDDEYLYTGIKSITVDDKQGTVAEATALEEMEGALAYAPNNSFFGSSSLRTPLPLGLWIYNGLASDSLCGIKKWFFNTFASQPKTITSASPATRAQVATNVLQNYGYFQGVVNYDIIQCKNPRKQKIAYTAHLGHPYSYDDIRYELDGIPDSILTANQSESFLRVGNQFSVADLQSEKTRLSTLFHNNGYYFYRPGYIHYFADSINSPGKVKLLVAQDESTPEKAKRPWRYGKVRVFLRNNATTVSSGSSSSRRGSVAYDDTIAMPRFDLAYQGKKTPIVPRVMMRNFKFWTGMLYNEDRVKNTLTSLTNMDCFSNVQFSFTPVDSTDSCDVLDVRLDATMDKLLDTEFEFNFTQKSNSQIGPDASITFSKRNAFRHGEKLALTLRGSYYWQLRGRSKEKINNLDSYDWGADVSLSYPWLVFPGFLNQNAGFRYPTSTKFSLSFTRNNIAKAYRYNQFGLGFEYNYQSSKYWKHTFTPLKIEVNDLRTDLGEDSGDDIAVKEGPTEDIPIAGNDSSTEDFPSFTPTEKKWMSLYLSDVFTPSMQYELQYDNSIDKHRKVFTNVLFNVKEAGLILNSIYSAIPGHSFSEQSKKFIKEYAQFIKGQLEVRNKFVLTPKSCIATRALISAAYAYGNSYYVPPSDQFYSGGAYSIRAFPARSLGPGRSYYSRDDFYMFHAGNFRLELNAEYRFPLFGNLNGALFVDAGNVWNIQSTPSREYIQKMRDEGSSEEEIYEIMSNHLYREYFLKDIALGTGFGFRYDMEFLVLRLDFGIAIHAPYKTSRSGYYNIPRFFKDGFGINFAVGYPF